MSIYESLTLPVKSSDEVIIRCPGSLVLYVCLSVILCVLWKFSMSIQYTSSEILNAGVYFVQLSSIWRLIACRQAVVMPACAPSLS